MKIENTQQTNLLSRYNWKIKGKFLIVVRYRDGMKCSSVRISNIISVIQLGNNFYVFAGEYNAGEPDYLTIPIYNDESKETLLDEYYALIDDISNALETK